jgi:hypothetical protein
LVLLDQDHTPLTKRNTTNITPHPNKTANAQEGVTVRWDVGLNRKRVALFRFGREVEEYEARLMVSQSLS